MKNKKLTIGIILIVIGVIGLFGLFGGTEDKVSLAIGSVVFIGVGVVLFLLSKKDVTPTTGKGIAAEPTPNPTKSATASTTTQKSVPDGEMNYDLFFDVSDGAVLCYEYEENLCLSDGAFEHISGNGGKPLTFKQEPDNQYDENAVAIYLNGAKIGYIYRGMVQDMFNDYTRRGWPVSGYLNKYSADNGKATYKIGFYKPLDIFEFKSFSLSKINKKTDGHMTREDALWSCDEGDALDIEYEEEDNCFIVYNDMYDEIGELPMSAAKFINENEHKKIVGVLDELSKNEDEKTVAKIKVYLVK